jgi:hypothetical protein
MWQIVSKEFYNKKILITGKIGRKKSGNQDGYDYAFTI